jgi:hypothetical protein
MSQINLFLEELKTFSKSLQGTTRAKLTREEFTNWMRLMSKYFPGTIYLVPYNHQIHGFVDYVDSELKISSSNDIRNFGKRIPRLVHLPSEVQYGKYLKVQ